MLDLVATAVEHKGDGHCRALLQALEVWLGPQLGVAKLVAVCPADVSSAVLTYAACSQVACACDCGAQHHSCARLHCACCLQEPRNLTLWQQKFGFKKLDARALKALQSSVPALNYYEESTLLSKTLKRAGGSSSSGKKQRRSASKEAAQEPAATVASLPVEPLKA